MTRIVLTVQASHISPLMTATSAWWRPTLIAVAVIGVLTMLPKHAVAEMPPALYKLGLPAAAGVVAVTISTAELSPDQQNGQAWRLVVSYAVKNISFDPVPMAEIPRIRLLDPTGGLHAPIGTPEEPPSGAPAADALDPGAEVRRTAVFPVAKEGFDRATWRLLVGGPHGPCVTLQ
jgi:hypothetical protein